MGVPTSEVGYTPAMPRRKDHEVHKGQYAPRPPSVPPLYFHFTSLIYVSQFVYSVMMNHQNCHTYFLNVQCSPIFLMNTVVTASLKSCVCLSNLRHHVRKPTRTFTSSRCKPQIYGLLIPGTSKPRPREGTVFP